MTVPYWFRGLMRVAWYVVLTPLSFLHAVLTIIGGGRTWPIERSDDMPLLIPWCAVVVVWYAAVFALVRVMAF